MLGELRDRILAELALDEEQRKNNPSSSAINQSNAGGKQKKENSVFENLGFPDHMTYGHRSNLRKECSRFLRYAYLVDFLALESLTIIYIDTVREFFDRLQYLDTNNNSGMSEQDIYQNRGALPMFKLSIMFDPERHAGTIVKERPLEFKLPPYGNSTVEDFDPTVHLELEPEKKKKENGEDASEGEEEDEEAP